MWFDNENELTLHMGNEVLKVDATKTSTKYTEHPFAAVDEIFTDDVYTCVTS